MSELEPRILVCGVGGAGGNAINNMVSGGLQGVEFLAANTDAQHLALSRSENRLQLGAETTSGLGAGARPEVGERAAEESLNAIHGVLDGVDMVFIAAGMGGGTGTGAAPVIAKAARDRGLLTVAVVTTPFQFEGRHRMRLAVSGMTELERYVDTLIVVPNQHLFRVATERTTFADAFKLSDSVLHHGVKAITDLIMVPGLINLDFADVLSVMSGMGRAMMGIGAGEGEDRAVTAVQNAISNPLLEQESLFGAASVLVNITGGMDMTLIEVDQAAAAVAEQVDEDANIFFGAVLDETMQGKISVSVVATGMAGERVDGVN